MSSLTISGAYVIAADQAPTYFNTDSSGGVIFLKSSASIPPGPDSSLTILGHVTLGFDNSQSILGIQEANGASNSPAFVTIGSGGAFTLDSAAGAIGYAGEAPFTNNGTFVVSGQTAGGVMLADYGTHFNSLSGFDNTGIFTVTAGANGTAFGVSGLHDHFFNSGTMTITGSNAGAVLNIPYGAQVTNSGSITATAIGMTIGPPSGVPWAPFSDSSVRAPMTITNSGVITAPSAITMMGGPAYGVMTLHLENSGTINGSIYAGGPTGLTPGVYDGAVIHNTGAINGNVVLDTIGDDIYDGRSGTLNGGLYLGAGFDRIYLGAEGETVLGASQAVTNLTAVGSFILGGAGADHITGAGGADLIDGGGGNDVLDGAGGINTVSYASAGAGVTVSLALQGSAQNTVGAGSDTLSNFQNLTGSAFADTLTGDGAANVVAGGKGNDTLTGGAGADTFVFGTGSGADVVTDFSHAEGDRIDLSAYRSVYSFDQIRGLLIQSGSDAVLHLPGGDQVTLHNVTASSLTAADFVVGPRLEGDFNGDGFGDLFWQNSANGLVSTWNLNDLSASGVSMPSAAGWQAMDVGDFDGNGYSGDILFRNPVTGKVDIWADTAGQMAGQDVDQASLDWQIMGVADFNGDGKSDILWRNEQNGYVSVWQMDGPHVAMTYNPGVVGLEWKVVGAGDFVGDGKAEVLWRNTATGEVNLWTIDGPGAGQTHGQTVATLPAEWKVVGEGDFNGDGRLDILWRDSVTTQVVIWEMNGASVQAFGTVTTLGNQWKVAAVADINGDGKSDIIWRDSGTGQVVGWAMDGFHVDHAGAIATADPSWQIINHHYDWT